MEAIIFDTETTGLIEPSLIEVAWLHIETPYSKEPKCFFERRYKPNKLIEPEAMAVHNIIDADLANGDPSSSFKLPECQYLIGHNIDYDWEVIGKPEVKRICTKALSRYLFPELKSFRQSALLYALCSDQSKVRAMLQASHSALGDAYNNLVLLGFLVEKVGTIKTWKDLWLLSEHAKNR